MNELRVLLLLIQILLTAFGVICIFAAFVLTFDPGEDFRGWVRAVLAPGFFIVGCDLLWKAAWPWKK